MACMIQIMRTDGCGRFRSRKGIGCIWALIEKAHAQDAIAVAVIAMHAYQMKQRPQNHLRQIPK